jgi:hypothetical protein
VGSLGCVARGEYRHYCFKNLRRRSWLHIYSLADARLWAGRHGLRQRYGLPAGPSDIGRRHRGDRSPRE